MKRFGHLPPRYDFVLNPYADERFTRCPRCETTTQERKVPLLIHIDPMMLISLRKTCRLCPNCELLICHQDELEAELVNALHGQARRQPEIIGNDYLVLGTMDVDTWRGGLEKPLMMADLPTYMHDFKSVRKIEPSGGGLPMDKGGRRNKGLSRPRRRRRK